MSGLRCHRLCLVVLLTGSFMLPAASKSADNSSQIAIIVSRLIPLSAINSGTLRNIYLKKVFLDSNGHAYVPVNLPPTDRLRRDFTRTVIHWNGTQLQDYWNRQYFQGVSPPYVLDSQAAVVEFVAKTPGAIGYVQPCYISSHVKVVLRLNMPGALAPGTPRGCPDQNTAH